MIVDNLPSCREVLYTCVIADRQRATNAVREFRQRMERAESNCQAIQDGQPIDYDFSDHVFKQLSPSDTGTTLLEHRMPADRKISIIQAQQEKGIREIARTLCQGYYFSSSPDEQIVTYLTHKHKSNSLNRILAKIESGRMRSAEEKYERRNRPLYQHRLSAYSLPRENNRSSQHQRMSIFPR